MVRGWIRFISKAPCSIYSFIETRSVVADANIDLGSGVIFGTKWRRLATTGPASLTK